MQYQRNRGVRSTQTQNSERQNSAANGNLSGWNGLAEILQVEKKTKHLEIPGKVI